ncbi:MAG TPA: DUF58 domain-containing protein [Terriglobales bacterium]|nr:DUF58 domain-containing protein [Terriglobales bacterium]
MPATVEGRAQNYKRLSVAFGQRFFLLLLIGLVWLGPAFIQPRFAYAILAWDAIVLLAWLADLTRLPRPEHLLVRRSWRTPVALSVPAEVEITLENSASTGVHATIVDDIPPELRTEVPEVQLRAPARGEASASYQIQPGRRGDVTLADAYIGYESPLRLARRWARARIPQTVRVYPNLEEARRHSIYLVRSRQIELEKRYTRIRGAGREFESLREYRPGDDFRNICWTASARRGKLVSRVYQIERSQTIWIVVDCGRLMRARVGGLSKLDYAANAGLSLAQVALYSGDRVGLLAYGRDVRHRLLPATGGAHLRHVVEALAVAREEGSEADHLRAAGVLRGTQKRRSLVVWLTDLAETATTPEVVEAAAQMMPTHLVLFVAIGQPDLEALAAQRPEDVAQMFQTTAAQEVGLRRELLLARLRERGVLAMEVNSRVLSTVLVNSYLEVKERNRL